MNETKLFDAIRSILGHGLTQEQIDSTHAILSSCVKHQVTDSRHIAYILATAFHESRLKPVEEIGKGSGRAYSKVINGHVYYGRGFVQLTWEGNYRTFGTLLKTNLVGKPELALQVPVAAEIIVIGMQKGLFTNVGLSRYFNADRTDPVNARKIINGLDKAELIAGYYKTILNGLI